MSFAHGVLLQRDVLHVSKVSYEPEIYKMRAVNKERR